MPNPIHRENGFEFFIPTENSPQPLIHAFKGKGFVEIHLGQLGFILPFITKYANLHSEEVESVWECAIHHQGRFILEWHKGHSPPLKRST